MAKGLFGRLVLPIVRVQKNSVHEIKDQVLERRNSGHCINHRGVIDVRSTCIAFSTTDPIGKCGKF